MSGPRRKAGADQARDPPAPHASRFVQQVVSIAEIQIWKPLPAIYRHAAQRAGVAPGETALVATRAWDVHGAKRAGLMGGFVARGQIFPVTMALPDVVGEDLAEVAAELAQ